MRIDDAIDFYGTARELASQLHVTPAAVTNWRARYQGKIPEPYARRLRDMTRGKLKFDPKAYGLDS